MGHSPGHLLLLHPAGRDPASLGDPTLCKHRLGPKTLRRDLSQPLPRRPSGKQPPASIPPEGPFPGRDSQ